MLMNLCIILSHVTTCIIYFYLLSSFLESKKDKKTTWIMAICYYAIMVFVCDFFFFSSTTIKPFISSIVLLISALLFFKGSFFKLLSYSTLGTFLMIAGEMIYVGITFLILKERYIVVTTWQYFISSICCHTAIFTLTRLFIRKSYTIIPKQSLKLFFLVIINITLTYYCFAVSFDSNFIQIGYGNDEFIQLKQPIFTFFKICIMFISFFVYKELKKTQTRISEELLVHDMMTEYEKHLPSYINKRQAESYLRHELIQFIEAYKHKDTTLVDVKEKN